MSKSYYVRYSGAFVAVDGVTWRADIEQLADEPFSPVGSLTFPAEEPLTIEWAEVGKEEVMHGSTATLQIESPGDRTYIDLYTIAVGSIRLRVYRDGVLYWSGSLDPEQYEEPYERFANYDVTLTFTDFGILDRLKYNLIGTQSARAILKNAFERACIGYTAFINLLTTNAGGEETELVASDGSTLLTDTDGRTLCVRDSTPASLFDDVYIQSANFCDEDGEWNTLKEVLEGILQPLGAHIQQGTEGRIILFDMNGLATTTDAMERITWSGDSQTLGVDRVANDVKITFSPYVESSVYDGELKYDDDYDTQRKEGRDFFTFQNCYKTSSDDKYKAHYVALSDKGSGLAYVNSDIAKYGLIKQYLGQAENNLVFLCRMMVANEKPLNEIWFDGAASSVTGSKSDSDSERAIGYTDGYPLLERTTNGVLYRTKKVFVPAGDAERDTDTGESMQGSTSLKIECPVLLDARYNPFETADDEHENENENYNAVNTQDGDGFVFFIPFTLVLYDADGNALYHYRNFQLLEKREIAEYDSDRVFGMYRQEWVKGSPNEEGLAYFGYYADDVRGKMRDKSGFSGGFVTNKDTLRFYRYATRTTDPAALEFPKTKKEEGEYIPLPPVEGYLELSVYDGVLAYGSWNMREVKATLTWVAGHSSAHEKRRFDVLGKSGGGNYVIPGTHDITKGRYNDVSTWNVLSEGDGSFKNPQFSDLTPGTIDFNVGLYEWRNRMNNWRVRHIYYKAPTITAVTGNDLAEEVEADDIEYSGYINKAAEEEISIDTICGTSDDEIPYGRGLYRDKDGVAIKEFTRAGHTDHPERLLIGTLMSNFATRHTKITGEADIPASGLRAATPYSERLQGSKKFYLSGATLDLHEGTAVVTIIEVLRDYYTEIEEVEE